MNPIRFSAVHVYNLKMPEAWLAASDEVSDKMYYDGRWAPEGESPSEHGNKAANPVLNALEEMQLRGWHSVKAREDMVALEWRTEKMDEFKSRASELAQKVPDKTIYVIPSPASILGGPPEPTFTEKVKMSVKQLTLITLEALKVPLYKVETFE